MLLVRLDLVDYFGGVLLLDLGRGCQQALDVVEDCALEEFRPS